MQAIAEELFKDMQQKEEASVSADVGRSSPVIQQVSSPALVSVTDMIAEETLDSSFLQDEVPAPLLAPADTRRLTEVRHLICSYAELSFMILVLLVDKAHTFSVTMCPLSMHAC